MNRPATSAIAVGVFLWLALAADAAPPQPVPAMPRYVVAPFPSHWRAQDSEAKGLSNGHVLGTVIMDSGPYAGFVFDGRRLTTGSVPGAVSTRWVGIDDAGNIAGTFNTAFDPEHAFVQPAGGEPRMIAAARDLTSNVQATTRQGVVVGLYREDIPYSPNQAYRWQAGVTTFLPPLEAGVSADAHGVSADGATIVGESNVVGFDTPRYATVWRNGVIAALHPLGRFDSAAFGVNAQGWVVGYSSTFQLHPRPVLWRDHRPIDLGLLDDTIDAIAMSINAAGTIVGQATTPVETWRAWLQANGRMVWLSDLVDGLPAGVRVTCDRCLIDDQGRISVTLRRDNPDGSPDTRTAALLVPKPPTSTGN